MTRFLVLLATVLIAVPAAAQVPVTHTFSPSGIIYSAQVNTNFSDLASNALNRTGGTITGNIAVSSSVTIDGVDLSAWLDQSVKAAASPTFAALTLTGAATIGTTLGVTGATTLSGALNANGAVDIAAGLTAGSGNVAIIDSTGKIPAISSTYIADLAGTNLTGVAKTGSANTYTAINNLLTYSETKTAPSISGGALTINLALGTQFHVSANANATITISNPVTSGSGGAFTLLLTQDGTARTFTWPASVKWAGGTAYAPTGTSTKVDAVSCIYNDGGTTYFCTAILNF